MKTTDYKKMIIFALLIIVSDGIIQAQGMSMMREGIVNDFSEVETLDKAIFICRYREKFRRDSINVIVREKNMLLEVGDHVSKYFEASNSKDRYQQEDTVTPYSEWRDSMRRAGYNKSTKTFFSDAIFRNYPEKKMITIDRVYRSPNSIYEEELRKPDWTLSSDTAIINGYLCRKATCSHGGRDYEAWYSPEIPVSEGPWKFYGLPGLILKVYDTNHFFTFECTSFHTEERETDIYIDKKDVVKTTKEKFDRLRKAYEADPLGYMLSASNGTVTIKGDIPSRPPILAIEPEP